MQAAALGCRLTTAFRAASQLHLGFGAGGGSKGSQPLACQSGAVVEGLRKGAGHDFTRFASCSTCSTDSGEGGLGPAPYQVRGEVITGVLKDDDIEIAIQRLVLLVEGQIRNQRLAL